MLNIREDNPVWNAHRFIQSYIDVATDHPNNHNGELEFYTDFLFARVMSLLYAYTGKRGTKCWDDFKAGKLLSRLSPEAKDFIATRFEPMFEDMGLDMRFGSMEELLSDKHSQGELFVHLLHFRIATRDLSCYWSRYVSRSPECSLVANYTGRAIMSLESYQEDIDHLLSLLLGESFQKTFTFEELVENYNFPPLTDQELYRLIMDN